MAGTDRRVRLGLGFESQFQAKLSQLTVYDNQLLDEDGCSAASSSVTAGFSQGNETQPPHEIISFRSGTMERIQINDI